MGATPLKVSGNLEVMTLPEVLQWIMNGKKTGRLEVERKSARRSIYCRDGHVVACFSNDPSMLLGQFLLCHGRISEATLREALERQDRTNVNLGRILVDMRALREDQLQHTIASKAMETIHGLFDWKEASFEFVPHEQPCEGTIEVDLRLEEVLLEGALRMDQMEEIREAFPSTDLVVERTGQRPDPDLLASPLARTIYAAIDGRKTVAEIRLVSHASEFLVGRFLLSLHERELISVSVEQEAPVAKSVPVESSLDSAQRSMERGDFYAALDILEPLHEANPNDETVKQMLSEAEARFVVIVYREGLHPLSVPRRAPDPPRVGKSTLSPVALHLLKRVDSVQSVRSILMVVPMRPVQVLRSLKMLQDRGLIEVPPPPPEEPTDAAAGQACENDRPGLPDDGSSRCLLSEFD